jgi:hypothetical protein
MEKIRIAAALVERYTANGRAISQSMMNAIKEDLQRIPAEVIADHVLTQLKGDALFRLARSLEFEGFRAHPRGFDQLSTEEKSFLSMLMDFGGIERSAYAAAWSSSLTFNSDTQSSENISIEER